MVDDLSLLRCEIEITVYLVIIERSDAGRSHSERFRGEVQAVANSACFEMHVPITTVSMGADGVIKISDHGKCHACIAGKVLSQTEPGGRNALISRPDLLQLSMLRPISIYARL